MQIQRFKDYIALCKPKVVIVMLMTSWIGMHLASINTLSWHILVFGMLGIGLSGCAAAVINHLADRNIDALMIRTQYRPIANGRISTSSAILFSLFLGISGLLLLYFFINSLTALLTFTTVIGYAIFYTLFLKKRTPQNIVIGGLAGAMPPLLGWTAVSNHIHAYALLLSLIIFIWTPPHFWSLAIYRCQEYQKAQIPMLPVTHGIPFTKLCILLYTCLLIAVTLLPFAIRMSGLVYFLSAIILGLLFLKQTLTLYKSNCGQSALRTFHFSIVYLLLLFMAILIDHHVQIREGGIL